VGSARCGDSGFLDVLASRSVCFHGDYEFHGFSFSCVSADAYVEDSCGLHVFLGRQHGQQTLLGAVRKLKGMNPQSTFCLCGLRKHFKTFLWYMLSSLWSMMTYEF
jgi:hypothetical protein